MLKIVINKEISSVWSKVLMEKTAHQAAKVEKKINGLVEINIVSEEVIKKLNKVYRGLFKVTDVLSFAWREEGVVNSEMLGQIYLCQAQIKRQAKSFSITVKEEMVRMLAHGLLHLVGHDHKLKPEADKMFALQVKIVAKSLN